MKKLLLILLFAPFVSNAQNLDTVLVRNLQLQAQDWAWLAAKVARNTDSTTIVTIRRIRAKVQSNIPGTWTTNVTVDSLPGRAVLMFYEIILHTDAGEIVSRFTAIKNAISAKVNLAYWVGLLDGRISGEFDRKRDIGRNILIDQ